MHLKLTVHVAQASNGARTHRETQWKLTQLIVSLDSGLTSGTTADTTSWHQLEQWPRLGALQHESACLCTAPGACTVVVTLGSG